MPGHSETRDLPFTCEQMFAVVGDIEKYPEFLPWCVALNVKSRTKEGNAEVLIAEMTVAYHGVTQSYTSRVRLDPAARTITAEHIQGPFERLNNVWRFEPTARGCRIHFTVDFAFKNWFLSTVAGIAFDAAAKRMTNAFVKRAKLLYGRSKRTVQ